MSEVRKMANRLYRRCIQFPGDVEGLYYTFGFLACAVVTGELSQEEVNNALRELDKLKRG